MVYNISKSISISVCVSISISTSLSISVCIYIWYTYYPYLWPTEYVYTLPILPTSRHLSSCHPKVQALASASVERRCCKRVYWCLRNGWERMGMDPSLQLTKHQEEEPGIWMGLNPSNGNIRLYNGIYTNNPACNYINVENPWFVDHFRMGHHGFFTSMSAYGK